MIVIPSLLLEDVDLAPVVAEEKVPVDNELSRDVEAGIKAITVTGFLIKLGDKDELELPELVFAIDCDEESTALEATFDEVDLLTA